MINLTHYQGDSFGFYSDALAAKRIQDYKNRMELIRVEVSRLFDDYSTAFHANDLETIRSHGYVNPQKDDLESLYSYGSSIVQKLKATLTTDSQNRLLNTCQNCTINSINSFDHFLPKSDFPEFSMNPLNLFPSCTECNSQKGRNWKDQNGNRRFLNLYLDALPQEQYLFVDFDFTPNSVTCNFRLEQHGINDELFDRITSHYEDLNLLKRFRLESDKVITEMINSIQASRTTLENHQIAQIIKDTEARNKITFGFNHWKSILKETIVDHNDLFDLA